MKLVHETKTHLIAFSNKAFHSPSNPKNKKTPSFLKKAGVIAFSFLALTFCMPNLLVTRIAKAETQVSDNTSLSLVQDRQGAAKEFYNAEDLNSLTPTLVNTTDKAIADGTLLMDVPVSQRNDKELVEASVSANLSQTASNLIDGKEVGTPKAYRTAYKVNKTINPGESISGTDVFATLTASDGLLAEDIKALPNDINIVFQAGGGLKIQSILPVTGDTLNPFTVTCVIASLAAILGALYFYNKKPKGAHFAKSASRSSMALVVGLSILGVASLCAFVPSIAKALDNTTLKETVPLSVNKTIYPTTLNANEGTFADGQQTKAIEVVYNGRIANIEGTTPTKDGVSFEAYTENEDGTGKSFDINARITEVLPVTLYAKWGTSPTPGTQYTVTFAGGKDNTGVAFSGTNLPNPQIVSSGQKIEEPQNVAWQTPDASGHTLVLWTVPVEVSATYPYGYKAWDFTNDTVTEDITLTARWIQNVATDPTTGTGFWLGNSKKVFKKKAMASPYYADNPVYATSGATTIIDGPDNEPMNANHILSDVEKIKAGDVSVISQYETYMNGTEENSDLYHLYTVIDGQSGEDAYAEFRIINVGEHTYYNNVNINPNPGEGNPYVTASEAKDESALTFQSVYALPNGAQMNKDTSLSIWDGTDLFTSLQKNGGIASQFKGLSSSVKPVMKTSFQTPATSTAYPASFKTTSQLFWLPSMFELGNWTNSAESVKTYGFPWLQYEGTQYGFYAQHATGDVTSSNPIPIFQTLACKRSAPDTDTTRYTDSPDAAACPSGITSGAEGFWWVRSAAPDADDAGDFFNVSPNGDLRGDFATAALAVVPAFSF